MHILHDISVVTLLCAGIFLFLVLFGVVMNLADLTRDFVQQHWSYTVKVSRVELWFYIFCFIGWIISIVCFFMSLGNSLLLFITSSYAFSYFGSILKIHTGITGKGINEY